MEIERKFLVNNLDFLKGKLYEKSKINQHYLYNRDGTQLRVRVKRTHLESRGFITVKCKLSDNELSRDEYEMEIPPETAKTLFEAGSDYGIYKYRYAFSEFASGKYYKIEVDEFRGLNSGLLMAEIEFESEKEAEEFNPLDLSYLAKEVTNDLRYKNDYLNKKPYSTW